MENSLDVVDALLLFPFARNGNRMHYNTRNVVPVKDVIYVRDASLGTFDDPIGILTFQFYVNLSVFSQRSNSVRLHISETY